MHHLGNPRFWFRYLLIRSDRNIICCGLIRLVEGGEQERAQYIITSLVGPILQQTPINSIGLHVG